ncbi:sugar phosphate isomerase/epimerase [Terriglobus roseus DSM 18391]|uniref:Sugar phosphate isomerase/epimerase n=1 Tax=Terriglobus roseus (strain DSM 18391 / NRRL B-41598 / KBS 63) TaxID=926566 RepID=I3ZB52_TERRK|nr:TIM barrel protein [Terriglobus roseus]AFL86470.1 sugar phosphate isomerase/epimerase [Terriglobus roseus DSM 18391]
MATTHSKPRLHNAMWPGIVGKGPDTPEPFIDLDTMLDLTAAAEVDGVKFDGVDLFMSDPHTSIDSTDDDLKVLADKLAARNLVCGSFVAPVWAPLGGGSAMGNEMEVRKFLEQVRKACVIGRKMTALGVRPSGVIRIDSAVGPDEWYKDPKAGTSRIAKTFREAGEIAAAEGQRLAAEGEICWAGMHGWDHMVRLLEEVNMPNVVGFQADMAHTMLYTLGYNSPESRIAQETDKSQIFDALKKVTSALRPWTFDFHVAQNDGTVKGQGSHDKTGRHCAADDPNGLMNIVQVAGLWMRDEKGEPTRKFEHICWDGCMFTNETMTNPQTWNKILATMIEVRNAHGWD